MGCFPSKKSVEDDQPRQRVVSSPTKTLSTPVKNANLELGNESYAKSYDEFRMIENDAFIKNLKVKEEQEIIRKTKSDMFDLSQLDSTNDDELEEKEYLYKDIHKKLNASHLKKFSLTKLSMKTVESDNKDELSNDPFLEFSKSHSDSLRKALKSIHITDNGGLIQNFPSLPSSSS